MDDKAVFRDVFNFWNKYKGLGMDTKQWQSAADELQIISDRHNCQLCNSLLIDVYMELSRINVQPATDD